MGISGWHFVTVDNDNDVYDFDLGDGVLDVGNESMVRDYQYLTFVIINNNEAGTNILSCLWIT